MPKIDDVGVGEETPRKMDHLRRIFSWHQLAASRAIANTKDWNSDVYEYIDLTAGKGVVPVLNEPGSPLVFLECVVDRGPMFRFKATLFEQSAKNAKELAVNLQDYSTSQGVGIESVEIACLDYKSGLRLRYGDVDDRCFGLVYFDPTGNPPDLESLKHMSCMRPKYETLLYVSSTAVKRAFASTGLRLSDIIAGAGKAFWLIREPIKSDKFQWTFLLGSNSNIFDKDYKKIKLVRVNSDKGRAILEAMSYTKDERKMRGQGSLFDE